MTVVEAAHTNVLGARGLGQKTSDFSAVPLCAAHHRESPDSYHRLGETGFAHEHGIDLHHVATELKQAFDSHVVTGFLQASLRSRLINFQGVGVLRGGDMTGRRAPEIGLLASETRR